jgi:hypothetical protein
MIRGLSTASDAADMLFFTEPSGGAIEERMRINSSGNVGIGTTSPTSKLEVNGGADDSVVFSGRSDGGNGNNTRFNIKAYADGASPNYGGGFKIQTRSATNVFADALTIDSGTNVHIGSMLDNGGDMYGLQRYTTNQANTPWIPYGGSNYTTLFMNTSGYDWMVGRLYYKLSISQVHRGILDFAISRYGGSLTHTQNGSYVSFSIQGSMNGNANHTGLRWTNTNGNSWGNGTMHMQVVTHSGGFTSGYPGLGDNFTDSSTGNFFRRTG